MLETRTCWRHGHAGDMDMLETLTCWRRGHAGDTDMLGYGHVGELYNSNHITGTMRWRDIGFVIFQEYLSHYINYTLHTFDIKL